MRAALAVTGVAEVPTAFFAMKYFLLKLLDGTLAGAGPAGSDCTEHCRRNYLLGTISTEMRPRPDGQEVDVPAQWGVDLVPCRSANLLQWRVADCLQIWKSGRVSHEQHDVLQQRSAEQLIVVHFGKKPVFSAYDKP